MLRIYWIGLVMLAAVLPACAQWILIDDFDQWENGDVFMEAADIGWHVVSADPDAHRNFDMWTDPSDSTSVTMSVYTGPADSGMKVNVLYVSKELPDGGILPGETGTLYFRCLFDGNTGWHIGTADMPLDLDPVTGVQNAPGHWSDFNALIRLGDVQNLEHRDGGSYVSTNPPVILEFNKWYAFYIVVENTWDDSTVPPTSTGVYSLYVQGPGIGDGVHPSLVPVGTDPPKDKAFFRRAPADEAGNPQPIRWLTLTKDSYSQMGCPSCGDYFLIDDIFFAHGANIGTGEPPVWWWGYHFSNSRRDVDTGDWMAWVNAYYAPYIWSYTLDGWIYMAEPVADATGAWGYIFK